VRSLEGVRILLVEDDDDTREITRMALEARGAVLLCAASADEALATIRSQVPDVLLSDICMPGGDGRSLLKRFKAAVKKQGERVPAVALTALDTREERMASREAGFHYHLTKPVDPEKLVHILSGLVRLTRF
jgi:CheY-like chemotaxis protein